MKVYAYQCNSNRKVAPVARLIKFFSGTEYSHYVLALVDEYNTIISVAHSHASGVEEMTKTSFLNEYSIYRKFAICEEKTHLFNAFVALHMGKKYGYFQNFGLLLKIWGIIKNNPFGKGSKRIICNELIILYLNSKGISNISDTDELNLKDTERVILGLKELK